MVGGQQAVVSTNKEDNEMWWPDIDDIFLLQWLSRDTAPRDKSDE